MSTRTLLLAAGLAVAAVPGTASAQSSAPASACTPPDSCRLHRGADVAPAAAPGLTVRGAARRARVLIVRVCVDRPAVVALTLRRRGAVERRSTLVARVGCALHALRTGPRSGARRVDALAFDADGRIALAQAEVA